MANSSKWRLYRGDPRRARRYVKNLSRLVLVTVGICNRHHYRYFVRRLIRIDKGDIMLTLDHHVFFTSQGGGGHIAKAVTFFALTGIFASSPKRGPLDQLKKTLAGRPAAPENVK
jgi:hypothetical protein